VEAAEDVCEAQGNREGHRMMVKDLMTDLESESRVTVFLELKEEKKDEPQRGLNRSLEQLAGAFGGISPFDRVDEELRDQARYEAQRQMTETPMFQRALAPPPVPQTATGAQIANGGPFGLSQLFGGSR